MAKTNAQLQSDYRARHLNKDKTRAQLMLDKEVADELDALRDHYGLTKQAVIEKLIRAEWKRVAARHTEKGATKVVTAKPKRTQSKKTAGVAGVVKT